MLFKSICWRSGEHKERREWLQGEKKRKELIFPPLTWVYSAFCLPFPQKGKKASMRLYEVANVWSVNWDFSFLSLNHKNLCLNSSWQVLIAQYKDFTFLMVSLNISFVFYNIYVFTLQRSYIYIYFVSPTVWIACCTTFVFLINSSSSIPFVTQCSLQ